MPGGTGAGGISNRVAKSSAVSPKAWPAFTAAMFASRTEGLPANLAARKSMVGSTGRLYIQFSRPSAYILRVRTASLRPRPSSAIAAIVCPVRSKA